MTVYTQQVVGAIDAVPGVFAAGATTGAPLLGTGGMPFTLVGSPTYTDQSKRPNTNYAAVTSDYYKAFGIPVIQGRSFDDKDTATSVRVAMVNQEFVKRYLKGMDPLKQRISMEELIPGVEKLGPPREWQIIGVFHNVRYGDLRGDYPEMDVPYMQSQEPDLTIGVRTFGNPEAMTRDIAAAVHSVDPEIALTQPQTLDEIKHTSLAKDEFTAVLYAGFALVGLILAAVGIYGLMAFSVSQRVQEIGLRIALGASKPRVMGMIMKEASLLAVAGLVIGLAGAMLVGRTMENTLYGVSPMNASVIVSVAMLLFVTAMFASYLPMRRAASVDPIQALRTD